METTENKLFTKRNILALLIVAILLLAIPFAMKLIKEQTSLRSKASTEAVKFVTGEGSSVSCDENGANCTTTSETVELELTSPLGDPAAAQ